MLRGDDSEVVAIAEEVVKLENGSSTDREDTGTTDKLPDRTEGIRGTKREMIKVYRSENFTRK